MNATEHAYTNECEAHRARRVFINLGHEVSLVAGSVRGVVTVYAFDVYAHVASDASHKARI